MVVVNYPKNRYTGVKPWMDREWLYNEYVIKDRSSQDIADEYGCVRNTIQCWLAKFKIKKKIVRKHYEKKYPNITKEFLIEENINKKKSLSQISRETGVSFDTLKNYAHEYGIDYYVEQHRYKLSESEQKQICELYQNEKISTNQLGKQFNVGHGTVKKILKRNNIPIRGRQEAQLVLKHEEIDDLFYDAKRLNDLHWNQNISCVDIGKMIGTDGGTIRRQMHRLGLETKDNSQCKIGLMTGENHPNWKGGITQLYYLLREYFTINLASKVVKRDNYTCQLCGKTHTKLHVHHIRPFKEIVFEIVDEHPELDIQDNKQELYDIITHDERFLDTENLITFCKDCHLFKIHEYKRRDN